MTDDGERLWFVGSSGAISEYDMASGVLTDHSAPNDVTNNFNDVSVEGEAGDANVYVAGDSGKIYFSFENGETGTWGNGTPGSGSAIKIVDFFGPRSGHAVNHNNSTFVTDDGGTYDRVGIADAKVNLYGTNSDSDRMSKSTTTPGRPSAAVATSTSTTGPTGRPSRRLSVTVSNALSRARSISPSAPAARSSNGPLADRSGLQPPSTVDTQARRGVGPAGNATFVAEVTLDNRTANVTAAVGDTDPVHEIPPDVFEYDRREETTRQVLYPDQLLVSAIRSVDSSAPHLIGWDVAAGDGSGLVGNSLSAVTVDYAPESGVDLSNVSAENVGVFVDRDTDIEPDFDVTDDVNGLSVSDNGTTLTITFDGNYDIEAEDYILLTYDPVAQGPTPGEYPVIVGLNGNGSDAVDETRTGQLTLKDFTDTDTANQTNAVRGDRSLRDRDALDALAKPNGKGQNKGGPPGNQGPAGEQGPSEDQGPPGGQGPPGQTDSDDDRDDEDDSDDGPDRVVPDLPQRDTVLFDGDGLRDSYELTVTETNPLYWDSNSTRAPFDQGQNGIIDGREDFDDDDIQTRLEQLRDTDPFAADTDGDGLDDDTELQYPQLDPTVADSNGNGTNDGADDPDGDGLTTAEEIERGTDPFTADTDSDGLDDGAEVNEFDTNPSDLDTDDDGLSDGEEIELGTDPLAADSDSDGTPDGQETFETSAENESLGVDVEFTGQGNVAATFEATNGSTPVVSSDSVDEARVSPIVDLTTDREFESADVTLSYNTSAVSADEINDLAVFRFDREVGTYVPLNSTVNPDAGTVTAETPQFSRFVVFRVSNWLSNFQAEQPENGPENGSDGGMEITPVDISFVIDSSGSMSGSDPNGFRKDAAKRFVGGLLDDDRASVVDFDGRARLLQGLTTDFEAVNSSIDQLDAFGGTNIGAGLAVANDHFASASNDSRAKIAVLLTDGRGSGGISQARTAAERNITVYTVGFGNANQNKLQRIANITGGTFNQVNDASELPEVFSRVQENATDTATDSDGDGLPDRVERNGYPGPDGEQITTDPFDADTDGDGIPDGEEIQQIKELPYRIAIRTPDDAYQISETGQFYGLSSDPTEYDSDGDGLSDFEESEEGWTVTYADNPEDAEQAAQANTTAERAAYVEARTVTSDPLAVDTDEDGVTDIEEFRNRTDPGRKYTVQDGIDDETALEEGLDPTLHDFLPPEVTVSGIDAKFIIDLPVDLLEQLERIGRFAEEKLRALADIADRELDRLSEFSRDKLDDITDFTADQLSKIADFAAVDEFLAQSEDAFEEITSWSESRWEEFTTLSTDQLTEVFTEYDVGDLRELGEIKVDAFAEAAGEGINAIGTAAGDFAGWVDQNTDLSLDLDFDFLNDGPDISLLSVRTIPAAALAATPRTVGATSTTRVAGGGTGAAAAATTPAAGRQIPSGINPLRTEYTVQFDVSDPAGVKQVRAYKNNEADGDAISGATLEADCSGDTTACDNVEIRFEANPLTSLVEEVLGETVKLNAEDIHNNEFESTYSNTDIFGQLARLYNIAFERATGRLSSQVSISGSVGQGLLDRFERGIDSNVITTLALFSGLSTSLEQTVSDLIKLITDPTQIVTDLYNLAKAIWEDYTVIADLVTGVVEGI